MKKCIALLLACLLLFSASALADTVLYRGKITTGCYLKASKDMDSANLEYLALGQNVNIVDLDTEWLTIRYNGQTGYILRNKIDRATAVDEVNTPPYGVEKSTYIATVQSTAPIYDADGVLLNTLGAGAKISILRLENGNAVIPYYRTFGYIDSRLLCDLIPVSSVDTPYSAETPIASFTTYFDYATATETNQNRVTNLVISCVDLCQTIPSGKLFDYNEEIGPFTRARGYLMAPVFADGTTKLGLGGGTCQVSSTLFNVLLQLPGISIVERRTHGRNGSVYLPVGMDSSVGTETLNLIFRNTYPFDLRIEAQARDGALFIAIWRVE